MLLWKFSTLRFALLLASLTALVSAKQHHSGGLRDSSGFFPNQGSDFFPWAQRSLQDEDLPSGEGASISSTHDTCEMALLVQPQGPGDEVYLVEDTSSLDDSVPQRQPCKTYPGFFGHKMYYTFVGTGNPFYISTCRLPTDPPMFDIETDLQLAKDLDCSDTDTEPTCVAERQGSYKHCPYDRSGISYAFTTEVGAEYLFSIETKDRGKYGLRVGELNASTEAPEEISLPEDTSVLLERSNQGLYDTRMQEFCPDISVAGASLKTISAGMWFVFDAPEIPYKVRLSTCTEETEVLSTVWQVLVGQQTDSVAGSPDIPDNVMCLRSGSSNTGTCNPNPDLIAFQFLTKPGERYFLAVSSQYPFDFGNIGLNITLQKEDTFGALSVANAEKDRREKRRREVSCAPLGDWVVDNSSYNLTCRDGCLYCESADSLFGGTCFNRTETMAYDINYQATFIGYALDVNYYQRNSSIINTIEYRNLLDGAEGCEFLIDGVQCDTCQKMECGAPLVSCGNVPGVEGTVWAAETLDLCSTETTVFAFGVDDHNVKGMCSEFLSGPPCMNAAAEFETEGFGCTCKTDAESGESALTCHSDCGLFCNEDSTVCGVYEIGDQFSAWGDLYSSRRFFDYILGESYNHVLLSSGQLESISSCILNVPFVGACADCQVTECQDSSRSGLLGPFGMTLDCTNIEGGSYIDTCNLASQIEEGPLQFLSAAGFDECQRLAPPFAVCDNARPIRLGAIYTGSTKYVAGESTRSVDCSASSTQTGRDLPIYPSLFYRVTGTGGWLRASTCLNETEVEVFPALIENSCGDDDTNCVYVEHRYCEGKGSYVEWETEAGMEYYIAVGGDERGSFQFQVEDMDNNNEDVEKTDLMDRCEDALAVETSGAYNCSCVDLTTYFDMAYLVCEPLCLRCDSNEDPLYCLDHYFSMEFNSDGSEARTEIMNLTGSFDGAVQLSMYSDQTCDAAIADRATIQDDIFSSFANDTFTNCTCEVITCEDGNEAAIIDCSEFDEGLQINLCEETEVSANNPLSTWIPERYGECYGNDATTSVERTQQNDPDKTTPGKRPTDDSSNASELLDKSAGTMMTVTTGLVGLVSLVTVFVC